MATNRSPLKTLAVCAAIATTAGLLASCAPGPRAAQTMQQSNPSVTYKYRGDQELLNANQQAAAYCNQYGTVPRTANLTNNPDGTNTVIFECVKTGPSTAALPPMAPLPPNPALTYTYRSDQELLDAGRRADAYCMNYGQRMVATSNIVTNLDGTRTATFQCGPAMAAVPR